MAYTTKRACDACHRRKVRLFQLGFHFSADVEGD